MRLSAPWPSWLLVVCSVPPASPAKLLRAGRSITAGATVTGVRSPKTVVRRARPKGSVEVTCSGPIGWMPRRAPVTEYENCTTRSAPRSPEPSAGNTPCALAVRPFGTVSRHVPGAVGSAVRTPTRTVTSASRPTVATSGDSDRVTVSERRVR